MVRRSFGWMSVCALLLSATMVAQQNATVQGSVIDESKGVMPGVLVSATEISTGRQSVAVTDVDGRYRLENLPPGKYTIRIELSGFATSEIKDVELLVGNSVTVPTVTLTVAGVTETVVVSTEVPLVRHHFFRASSCCSSVVKASTLCSSGTD